MSDYLVRRARKTRLARIYRRTQKVGCASTKHHGSAVNVIEEWPRTPPTFADNTALRYV